MKIAFLVSGINISGGMNVIFEHAVRVNRRRIMQVYMITTEAIDLNGLFWHPEAKELKWLTYEEAKDIELDAVIATFWATCYEANRLQSKHYIYFNQSVESKFYDVADIANRKLAESTYLLGYHVITEATWIKNYLFDNYGIDAQLVLNGIRKDIYTTNGHAIAPRENGKLRILVEGPMGVPFKNVEKTIELCLRSDADEVWLLTSSKITDYSGIDRVFSQVAISKTAEIYRSCDVLIKLSYVEGMFGPPLEMFHCGGTAIVYDVTGHDEYISHNQNAIVIQTDNESAVIDAINFLKDHPEECNRLKIGALETANRWNDWESASMNFEKSIFHYLNETQLNRIQLSEKIDFFRDWFNFPKQYVVPFAQIFIDTGFGCSEENSLKLPVVQNTELQTLVFDLSSEPNITALRFDPFDDSCVIEIEKCTLISNQSEIDLRERLTSNALIHHESSYFFDHNDPQIYFNDFSLDQLEAKSFIVKIRFTHIGNDALHACINQITINHNQEKSSICWRITHVLRKVQQILKGK